MQAEPMPSESAPSDQNPFVAEVPASNLPSKFTTFIEKVKGLSTEQWLWITFGVSCFLTLIGIWKWIVLTVITLPISIVFLYLAVKARNSRIENTPFHLTSEMIQLFKHLLFISKKAAKTGTETAQGMSTEKKLWVASAASIFVFIFGVLTWVALAWIAASVAMFFAILAAVVRNKRIENELESMAIQGDTRALYDLADRYYRQSKPGKVIRLFERVVAESENREAALSKLEAYVDNSNFPDAPNRSAAQMLIYKLIQEKNTIATYADYYSKYPDAPNRNKVLDDMYKLVREENTIAAYVDYYSNYPSAPNLNTVLMDMYRLIKERNTIADYADYCSKYPSALNRSEALTDMYKLVRRINTIADYVDYYFKYPNAPNLSEVLTDIYELVKPEKNVARYYWFLVNFPNAPQLPDALMRMFTEMFRVAQQINTIEALNDFIIACPAAREINEARNIAYRLEKERYTPTNPNDRNEKDDKARLLLNKSWRIWLDREEVPFDRQFGYAHVVKRMHDLMEAEFPSQKATSEMLENEQNRNELDKIKDSLDILNILSGRIENAIHQNTEQTAELIWKQTAVMSHHFGIIGNTLDRIADDTQAIAQSSEFANEISKQFTALLEKQRDETKKLRSAVER